MPPTSLPHERRVDYRTVQVLERVYGSGDLREVVGLFAADYIEHDPASLGPVRGPESVMQSIGTFRRAFPDLELSLAEQVTEGDTVLLRWTGFATHSGSLHEFGPIGRRVAVNGTTVTRIDRGKAVEGWSNWEFGVFLRPR